MSLVVWNMEGRRDHYWIQAEVYKSAHDRCTFIARIEDVWSSAPVRVYDIKFGFKTQRAAASWARAQRRVVRTKIQRAQRERHVKGHEK